MPGLKRGEAGGNHLTLRENLYAYLYQKNHANTHPEKIIPCSWKGYKNQFITIHNHPIPLLPQKSTVYHLMKSRAGYWTYSSLHKLAREDSLSGNIFSLRFSERSIFVIILLTCANGVTETSFSRLFLSFLEDHSNFIVDTLELIAFTKAVLLVCRQMGWRTQEAYHSNSSEENTSRCRPTSFQSASDVQ